jgi:hypothetical protein
MTGRSASLAAIIPVPFSFSSSQSHASSQMGKAKIAPIVSGTQIKTSASIEALALESEGAKKRGLRLLNIGDVKIQWDTISNQQRIHLEHTASQV